MVVTLDLEQFHIVLFTRISVSRCVLDVLRHGIKKKILFHRVDQPRHHQIILRSPGFERLVILVQTASHVGEKIIFALAANKHLN